jgi:hypothetical protein
MTHQEISMIRFCALALLTMPAAALAAPTLSASGACPGIIDLDSSGLSGDYALISASGPGSVATPGGPCAGTMLALSPAGLAFRGVHRSDGAGMGSISPSIPAVACGAFVQIIDLGTCETSGAVELGGAEPAWVEFPSRDSMHHTGAELGEGGGGRYFQAGDYLEETFDGTGLGRITSADAMFDMDDFTNGACVVGPLSFDATINGVWVGTYGYDGGGGLGRMAFDESWSFGAITGEGAAGDSYTVRFEANETVCPGGGSWNWFPDGSLTLY